MFAIKANEIDTTSGRTRRNMVFASPRRAPYPTNRLQQIAIAAISPQAASGMRFNQAAWVYPLEFKTSFMPVTAVVITGVGCASAGTRTVDHRAASS